MTTLTDLRAAIERGQYLVDDGNGRYRICTAEFHEENYKEVAPVGRKGDHSHA